MSEVFGAAYAQEYDLLYQDKDYDAEVELLEQIFREYALPRACRVLDLGCGTGQHAVRLARRGHDVTGVDRSSAMLSIARVCAAEILDPPISPPRFIEGDVTTVRLGGAPFDAALMMFAVLGYQTSVEAVRAALETVRVHVREGAVFVCDVWYGPAVLLQRPTDRTKVVHAADGHVSRSVHTTLDLEAQCADVHYRMRRLRDDIVVAETRETHRVRFFFPQELALLFERAGMELVQLRAFGAESAPASDSTWNVLAVGRAT